MSLEGQEALQEARIELQKLKLRERKTRQRIGWSCQLSRDQ